MLDLSVTRNSPAGSCVLAEVMGLADEYDITVFSDSFDNARPDRVQWVRVPLPRRPGFLKYIVFHLLAPSALRRHTRERGTPPALIQATQGQFFGADICYPHFCHRAYLSGQWPAQKTRGLRRLLRWASYRYNAFSEARAFRLARCIVAPSQGLVRELVATYPFIQGRVRRIANPVDIKRFRRPDDLDSAVLRSQVGIPVDGHVISFVALGDFERKGLGIVLDAMVLAADQSLHLLIVGGSASEVALFERRANRLGLASLCTFVGLQSDVRPYLWMSELFVFPSAYETFSFAVIQALASGVPAISTRVHGVEEYLVHGRTGWLVERTAHDVAQAIRQVFANDAKRLEVAAEAQMEARRYGPDVFVGEWRRLIAEFARTSKGHEIAGSA